MAFRVPRVPRKQRHNVSNDNGDGIATNAFSNALRALAPDTVPKIAGYLTATGLAAAGVTYYNYLTTDSFLSRLDPDFHNKCYSPDEKRGHDSATAKKEFQKITGMIAGFGERGKKIAESYETGKTTLCVGIDDPSVSPMAHWSVYDVHFMSSATYPEMMSLFMAADQTKSFWDSKLVRADAVNEYVPQSGLLFSRAEEAVQAVEKIRNFHRAIDDSVNYIGSGSNEKWAAFLQENPELKVSVDAYLKEYSAQKSEDGAMKAAMETFMHDPAAVGTSDGQFLISYNDHVRVIGMSSYDNIYRVSGSDADYAWVDADRDGKEDDLIRLNWRNQQDGVTYDFEKTDGPSLRRKRETYICTKKDMNGKSHISLCMRDVRKTFYYESIPNEHTASVHIAPETLVALANLTETPFLNITDANVIVSDTAYSLPLTDTGLSLLADVEENRRKNIPADRDTGKTAPLLGIR